METPQYLYRYRPACLRDIANLATRRLWFSNVRSFNDPFDCALDVVLSEPTTAALHGVVGKRHPQVAEMLTQMSVEQRSQMQRRAAESIRKGVENAISGTMQGVCCFSELKDHLLMWSHYSDGHRGFCLEFKLRNEIRLLAPLQVQYWDTFPPIDSDRLLSDGASDFTDIMNLWLVKAKCWEYEKEWRILNAKGDCLSDYSAESLTAVYLGAQMSEDQQLLITKLVEGTPIQVRKMRLQKSSFSLVEEDIT